MLTTFSGFLFFGIIFIEIIGIIIVWGRIGAIATLLMIFLSILIGINLLKRQGITIIKLMNKRINVHDKLDREIAKKAMIIMGAFLFILPGFFSDIIGIFFLFKPFQEIILYFLSCRSKQKYNIFNKKNKIITLDKKDYDLLYPKKSTWKDEKDKNP